MNAKNKNFQKIEEVVVMRSMAGLCRGVTDEMGQKHRQTNTYTSVFAELV
jgi:hypothetical protein